MAFFGRLCLKCLVFQSFGRFSVGMKIFCCLKGKIQSSLNYKICENEHIWMRSREKYPQKKKSEGTLYKMGMDTVHTVY